MGHFHWGLGGGGLVRERAGAKNRGRCGMRHLIVAMTMIMTALAITCGAASVLQGVATAVVSQPEPFVIEAARPALKPAALKERLTIQARQRVQSEIHVSAL